MKFRRFFSILSLLSFCLLAFQWELEQVVMWQRMVRAETPELGVLAAADRALSGEAPCSKCKQLARVRVSESSEEEMAASTPACDDLFSLGEGVIVSLPVCSYTRHCSGTVCWQSRDREAPPLPPV